MVRIPHFSNNFHITNRYIHRTTELSIITKAPNNNNTKQQNKLHTVQTLFNLLQSSSIHIARIQAIYMQFWCRRILDRCHADSFCQFEKSINNLFFQIILSIRKQFVRMVNYSCALAALDQWLPVVLLCAFNILMETFK